MFDFKIKRVGLYTTPESFLQTVPLQWIALHVSGLKRLSVHDTEVDFTDPPPLLWIALPGERISFETMASRRNYIAALDELPLRKSSTPWFVEIQTQSSWSRIPKFVHLSQSEGERLDKEFSILLELSKSLLDADRFAASCLVASILRNFIATAAISSKATAPVDLLRALLEQEKSFTVPIPALCRQCGMSASHLRMQFRKKYGIGPIEYRMRKRMSIAMELLLQGEATVKEIAERTSFGSLPHFSGAFRAHFGLSPREAIAKFRISNTTS